MMVERISPEEAHRRKQCGECDLHLDVRTPEEYKDAHAPNSVLVPFMLKQGEKMVPNPDFLRQVEQVTGGDHGRRIIVNCASGRRSAMAAEELSKVGYQTVADMEGGMQQYLKHAHLPVNTATGE
jgi:rhodanese-related sulfurtransferase